MEPDSKSIHLEDLHHPRELSRRIMRRQLGLSIRIAIVFLVLIFGLPLVNAFLPNTAASKVGGFTASWLFLALLFYPITWVLSAIFIRSSNKIEQEIANDMQSDTGTTNGAPRA